MIMFSSNFVSSCFFCGDIVGILREGEGSGEEKNKKRGWGLGLGAGRNIVKFRGAGSGEGGQNRSPLNLVSDQRWSLWVTF